jgi:hypothetical protein
MPETTERLLDALGETGVDRLRTRTPISTTGPSRRRR